MTPIRNKDCWYIELPASRSMEGLLSNFEEKFNHLTDDHQFETTSLNDKRAFYTAPKNKIHDE